MSDWLDAHAMADGQLDADAVSALEKKIAEDPAMAAEYKAVQELKQVLRKCEAAPAEDAWKACRARLAEVERSKKVESFVGRYAWGMCSVFLVLIVSAAMMNRSNPGTRLGAGDLAYMASGLSPISGASQNTQRYLEEFGPVKPLITPERLTIRAVANGFVDGIPAVRWDLSDKAGDLTLIAIRAEGVEGCQKMATSNYRYTRIGSGVCLTWCGDSYTVALIGDRSPEELVLVADQIRN